MKTKAAVLHGPGEDWEIEEIDLGDPVAGEVQVRLAASGLCHSDEHLRTGASPVAFYPVVGGHEGAGVVTKVGPDVTGIAEGDHVVLAFIPGCGACRACARGMQNLCDAGGSLLTGKAISDGTHRLSLRGKPMVPMCLLGTFAPYVTVNQASVIKIEDDVPLDKAALLGCGVSTGWGSATEVGNTRAGDTVVVVGVGGVGINSVQGAAAAGARYVIAVDPVAFKREKALELGATHAFESMADAAAAVGELTWGQNANTVILTKGEVGGDDLQPALSMTAKGGQVVVVGMGHYQQTDAKVSLFELTLLQKRVQGAIFGGVSPRTQIPRLLELYRHGTLKLDELVTNTYRLEDINAAYQDMRDGKNLRGVVIYGDADH
ncbi:NDMA-dependent alcohol dehydrogenase [Saccharopolyspora shandongensis]|uniref:S-(Hydroxymethyl)glutathione dehydrogenase / alcohol dehydrogenase n=1 Tax=Saccharopolyspora shandongensis TaxID=418495 RepID=A0A1H3RSH1_9PSEU|nr:NDMA-dependent alcohol dehydrogenase [Saccharopolyspora shandongensis]SDZ28657.1 S-(hydroxymethyl)glutathione dehydrogenase / alcohol dehydrogenase [Saccharopolyspora shandongensis]